MKYLPWFCFAALIALHSCAVKLGQQTANVAETPHLRVLSYNVHHCNPPSKPGLIDIDAIAQVIIKAQPDVVALQEIDVHTARSGKDIHEAELLGEKTGMKAYFVKGIDYDGGEYGIAILSSYPMSDFKKYELPTIASTKGEPRVLATVVLDLPGNKKIRFACTHLDAQRSDTNRVLQIQKIADVLKNETLPVILAGDLNAVPGSATINTLDRYLVRSCLKDCGFTIPEVNPNKTIDFIAYSRGMFSVMEHTVIAETYASDHRPVIAVLKLK